MKPSKRTIKILAIETSCDETAAAVICGANLTEELKDERTEELGSDMSIRQYINEPRILSSVVSSQIDLHAKTGGVVPEVASRAHMEAIIPVVKEALVKANSKSEIPNSEQIKNLNVSNLELSASDLLSGITHLAVTAGPGLIGSLLVGFNTAKSLACALDIPIIPVNHIEGHIYSALAQNTVESRKSKVESGAICNLKPEDFPILALTVSGGHSSLTLMRGHGVYENIGATLDDAAGEAFDKVAKLLDLGYPGGPALSKVAAAYREQISNDKVITTKKATDASSASMGKTSGGEFNISLPLPLAHDDSYNFSFSGLKTSVLNALRKAEKKYQNDPAQLAKYKQELASVFEETAVAHLMDKTLKAIAQKQVKNVLLAGGVSANVYLRDKLQEELEKIHVNLLMPPLELTGDNAAMIGLAAYYHIISGDTKAWNEIKIDSNLPLQTQGRQNN